MKSERLYGRAAIVTGAARGQGAAHARRLAEEGASVLLTDVLDDLGESHAEALRGEGLNAQYAHLDVSDDQQWRAAVDFITSRFGAPTILVNNAGVSSRPGVADPSVDEWQRVIAINQTGVLFGMAAVIPSMRSAGGGSIVNVSSLWAHTGGVGSGNIGYVATKAAVLGMTKNAALDLGRFAIRVNSVSPGYLDHLMSGKPDETVAEVVPRIPLARLAHIDEISGAVAFLASDDSAYITGIDIVVDGGLQLG